MPVPPTHERDDERRVLPRTCIAHVPNDLSKAHEATVVWVKHHASAEEHEFDEEPPPAARPVVRLDVWGVASGVPSRPHASLSPSALDFGFEAAVDVERVRWRGAERRKMKPMPDLGKVQRAPRTGHLVEINLPRIAQVRLSEHLVWIPRPPGLAPQLNVVWLVQAHAEHPPRQLRPSP
jgi:hypothetical protein